MFNNGKLDVLLYDNFNCMRIANLPAIRVFLHYLNLLSEPL